jgi:uncharacterized protein YecE (DUF72 family)
MARIGARGEAHKTALIGIAGWALDAQAKPLFGEGPSHLARYATRFSAVEINSSFYRPHRNATYARWAATVPDGFHFSVKLPRAITHEARLVDSEKLLDAFQSEIEGLGVKLGPILIQLPPSLRFDPAVAEKFLEAVRSRFAGKLVIEPRHASWGSTDAELALHRFRMIRADVDPLPFPMSVAGRHKRARYFRLHGSPVIYRSRYSDAVLKDVAAKLKPGDWCIFDNTAEGAAIPNALALQEILNARQR